MFILSLLIIQSLFASPETDGNCISGVIRFNADRMVNNVNNVVVNPDLFDIAVDYGSKNVLVGPDGVTLFLTKIDGTAAQGVRLSSSRYILYGRIAIKMTAVPVGGVITAYDTMSKRGDEIDWEIIGSETNSAQTNVFYKGIKENNKHGSSENVNDIASFHVYEVDWRHETITWSIDGTPVRSLSKSNSTSTTIPSNEKWFPSTPSQVQIAVWDGGSSSDAGTSKWAGGPIQWGSRTNFSAQFEYIEITCYDDNDQPVVAWPSSSNAKAINFPFTPSIVNGTKFKSYRADGSLANQSSMNHCLSFLLVFSCVWLWLI